MSRPLLAAKESARPVPSRSDYRAESPVVIFLPAGSLYWLDAWIFFALYFCWAIPLVWWLLEHNPELLLERMKGGFQEGQKRWDRVFMVVASDYSLSGNSLVRLEEGYRLPPLRHSIRAWLRSGNLRYRYLG